MIEFRQNLRICCFFHLHIWLYACIFSLGWCKFILKEAYRSIAELQIPRIRGGLFMRIKVLFTEMLTLAVAAEWFSIWGSVQRSPV
jgi:hypothetical protein